MNKAGKSVGALSWLTVGAVVFLAGCASGKGTVRQLAPSAQAIDSVCIERNEAVRIADLLPTIEQGFKRNGVQTQVVSGTAQCHHRVWYTGTRRWDVVPYMVDARVNLFKGQELIAEAVYTLPGGGGLNPAKWDSVATKLDPLIDEMLANVRK